MATSLSWHPQNNALLIAGSDGGVGLWNAPVPEVSGPAICTGLCITTLQQKELVMFAHVILLRGSADGVNLRSLQLLSLR